MVMILSLSHSEQINQHLDSVQGDLESLKEFLRNEDYTLDANALLGVSIWQKLVSDFYWTHFVVVVVCGIISIRIWIGLISEFLSMNPSDYYICQRFYANMREYRNHSIIRDQGLQFKATIGGYRVWDAINVRNNDIFTSEYKCCQLKFEATTDQRRTTPTNPPISYL